MNQSELMAYFTAAMIGGAVAGEIAGPLGTLGVFAGVALIGYVEMIIELSKAGD